MNETKTTVLLEHHLKALKLPTVLREYVPVAAACRQDKADYATYLLRLTERELLDRERRAADRRLQAARSGPFAQHRLEVAEAEKQVLRVALDGRRAAHDRDCIL